MRDIINSLSNKKSNDIYGLNTFIIKKVKDVIIIPLTKLLNQCIDMGIFPDALKTSKVIPIFKKGNKDDPCNYRPISLVPIFSKILEKVIKSKLTQHLESNGLLHVNQFGFRQGRSTVGAVNKCIEIINEAFEKGEYAQAILCDLSKAFDCVSHDILLKKLNIYDVGHQTIKIIQSFLTNRKQVVHFKNKSSVMREIRRGVPQGSVLGPLLFIIYINDLLFNSPNDETKVIYADDTTILNWNKQLDTVKVRTENSSASVNEWFTDNELCLNIDKTQIITLTLRAINDISNPRYVKLLGLYIDPTLRWDGQVDMVAKKLTKSMYVIRRLVGRVPFATILTAYFALCQSVMSYGILVWGHAPYACRIFALQRKIIRIIAKADYRADCRPLFKNLKILTFPSLYIVECLMYIKNTNMVKRGEIHTFNTRQQKLLCVPYHRLSRTREGPNYWSQKLFNSLPEDIRDLEKSAFKREIKKFLNGSAVYSVSEFLKIVQEL